MINNKKNVLVTLADANFVSQAKQLFSSVYFNAGWTGDYLLLACGISEQDLAWFKTKGVLIYDCPLLTEQSKVLKSYPPVVLSKFYLFKEYFKQWEKIIFLDADIIVRASLGGLLELEGFNAPEAPTFILADEFEYKNLTRQFRRRHDLSGKALNTGVLVFDTDLITEKTYDELLSLYQDFKNVSLCNEESILNIYFYKQWQILPVTYNSAPWYIKRLYNLEEDQILAFIIHFICCTKPWDKDSSYHQEWLDNLAKAEEINLNKRPAAKLFPEQELDKYLKYLAKKDRITWFFSLLSLRMVDRKVGLWGILIAKKYPRLYKYINLKRFKSKIGK